MINLFMLCLSCSPPARLIFFSDEYFWKLINSGSVAVNQTATDPAQAEQELTRLAKNNGLRWQLKLTNLREHNFSALSEVLTLNQQSVVIVSPLVMLEVEQLMYQFPKSAFITLDAIPDDLMAPNLLAVTFDRRIVYKELGQRLAKLMQSPDFSKSLARLPAGANPVPLANGFTQADATVTGPVKLGILASYPTQRSREEVASFKEGLTVNGHADLIQEKEFVFNPGNQPDLLSVFDEMYKAGVRLFFLKMYNYTEPCLEVIKTKGGQAIIEDGSRLQALESYILLSIDEDYLGSLQAALAQLSRGSKGITIKNKSLPGKFTLNWNKTVDLK